MHVGAWLGFAKYTSGNACGERMHWEDLRGLKIQGKTFKRTNAPSLFQVPNGLFYLLDSILE